MSQHVGYIVKIEELHPHSNADRLQIATIFGASVIVGINTKIGDIGVYFPIDLQLSEEYCRENDLVRRKDENGNPAGGYLDPDKRNIRAMKLRGEQSEGLFMPLSSLDYIYKGTKVSQAKFALQVGDTVDVLSGHEICRKYIPRTNTSNRSVERTSRTRKHKVPIAPLFAEHADTEQLVYNMDAFKDGDQIEITLKMHGTSGRTAYLPVLKGFKRTLLDKIFRREGTPIYDWGYATGTRRVVLDNQPDDGGFYGDNTFRRTCSKFFEGKLWKGETVYYEIVGFTNTGVPIMSEVSNSKISDKEFTKQYGKTTTFSYGCSRDGDDSIIYQDGDTVPKFSVYVYRMTMTNEDGDVVEYTPDFMRYRCEQMGAKTVPVFWKGYIDDTTDWNDAGMTAGEWAKYRAEQYYDGPDPIGKTHVREGVVIRIVNRPKFTAYKHKNFNFKVLSGIAADLAAESGAINEMDEDRISEL